MSTFPFSSHVASLDTFAVADLTADMGLTSTGKLLMTPPGGVIWDEQAFITRGLITSGSSLPAAYVTDLDSPAAAQAQVWDTVAAWITAYPEDSNTCTNAYLKISGIQIHIMSASTGIWTRIDDQSNFPNSGLGQWSLDFTTSHGTAPKIYGQDGIPAYSFYRSGAHIMLHNSITPKILLPDAADVGGVFVTCQSQLIPAIGAAFDATPQYLLSVGADYYPDFATTTIGAGMLAGVTYIPAVGASRFKTIPTDGTKIRHYFTTYAGADTYVMSTSAYAVANGVTGMYQSLANLTANTPVLTANERI